jgi:hypothetical protein
MRRLLLACLLAVPAAAAPASASPGACVATSALPVCAGLCATGEVISVRVVGNVTGTARCGGAVASCFAFRGTCSQAAVATSSGPLTCTVTGGTGVAYCDVKIAVSSLDSLVS